MLACSFCKNNPSDTSASGGTGDSTDAKVVPYAYTFMDTTLVSLGPKDFYAVTKVKPNMPIIDVRSERQYKTGHIWRAVNMDVNDKNFYQRIASFGRDQDYAVYCQTGEVSLQVAEAMKKMGFLRIYHLQKGLVHWSDTGQALQIN